jgi:hypothetical protein
MLVFLFRPSPQVPKPSVRSALVCYDASAHNIKVQAKQMETALVDITWVFVLALFMALNTILWTMSYPEVRSLHGKEEFEENIDIALDIITKCRERWPGTAAAFNLYSKLAKACLRSYDMVDGSLPPSSVSANSPTSVTDHASPPASEKSSATSSSNTHSQKPYSSPPQFNHVFNQTVEQVPDFDYSTTLQPPNPGFRSNSIFLNPHSCFTDRRFSYFPPEFAQPPMLPNSWAFSAPSQASQLPSNPLIPDPTFFMQPTPYYYSGQQYTPENYNPTGRQGSLSQQQQVELMQSLETDGLTEIDNYMYLSTQYDKAIKL